MKRVRTKLSLLAVSTLLLVQHANACSVCGVAKDEARAAYYATTAILSFLPLIMIGAVVYYLFKKRSKE